MIAAFFQRFFIATPYLTSALAVLCLLIFSQPSQALCPEADSTHSLSVALDNDLFVPGTRDQDYTAGMTISYTSKQSDNPWNLLDAPLAGADRLFLGLTSLEDTATSSLYTVEAGLYGFTPEDKTAQQANSDDRPFASLLYVSSSREYLNERQTSAWQSRLTVGVLGLEAFANLQNAVHQVTGSTDVQGWDSQISDGGELTARYQLSKQSLINGTSDTVQLKWAQQVSVGYLTEASLSISARAGHFGSGSGQNWWHFNPELASYGEQRTSPSGLGTERYFFAGVSIKARLYNAFLQGQFKHSEVSYKHDELNHLLLEAWAGYSHSFGDYQLTYSLRGQSSEVKTGTGDRNLLWGGITLGKSWL